MFLFYIKKLVSRVFRGYQGQVNRIFKFLNEIT